MPEDMQSDRQLIERYETKKQKKGMTKADLKKLDKEKEEAEAKRKKEKRKYKIFIPNKSKMYPFLACDGPCTFDINLGTQVFHCSNDEFNKGVMQ